MWKKIERPLPRFLVADNSNTAILFVHGLGGSSKTWSDFSERLDAEWTEKDNFNLEYDEYYKNYYNIPVFSFIVKSFMGKDINNLSKHLDSVIKTVCEKYEHVILICHSMGGLIARQYIVNKLKKDKNLGKIKALITYATPHLGSYIANYCRVIFHKPLALLRIKKLLQVSDLSNNGDYINKLNEDWSMLNINDKIDFIRVIGMEDWIVNTASGEFINDENVHYFANKDHFSIIKPNKNIKDPALYVSYNYLKDFNENLEKKQELDEFSFEEESDYEF